MKTKQKHKNSLFLSRIQIELPEYSASVHKNWICKLGAFEFGMNKNDPSIVNRLYTAKLSPWANRY